MKWKEFKTQKGLIAEHSLDLTILTKKLLQHYLILRGKQKAFFLKEKMTADYLFMAAVTLSEWVNQAPVFV